MIKDSGERREFKTGAVRDIQVGKGRCDLMPLDVVTRCMGVDSYLIHNIARFLETNKTSHLVSVLKRFALLEYDGSVETMFLEVAKHFEEGAKKYGENNWQKGLPTNCYIDSAIRHYLKYKRGDKDEPHERAFVWNIMCCIWEVDYRDKDREH